MYGSVLLPFLDDKCLTKFTLPHIEYLASFAVLIISNKPSQSSSMPRSRGNLSRRCCSYSRPVAHWAWKWHGPASFMRSLLRLWKRRFSVAAIFLFDGSGQEILWACILVKVIGTQDTCTLRARNVRKARHRGTQISADSPNVID